SIMRTGIAAELQGVANAKPLWSRLGTVAGSLAIGLALWCRAIVKRGAFPLVRHHGAPDFAHLEPIAGVAPRQYARPDGTLTFDRASSVYLANLAHDEDQPVHLKLADPDVPIRENLPRYGEPAPLYCPAGVY